jgi:hypothetical protein
MLSSQHIIYRTTITWYRDHVDDVKVNFYLMRLDPMLLEYSDPCIDGDIIEALTISVSQEVCLDIIVWTEVLRTGTTSLAPHTEPVSAAIRTQRNPSMVHEFHLSHRPAFRHLAFKLRYGKAPWADGLVAFPPHPLAFFCSSKIIRGALRLLRYMAWISSTPKCSS